MKIQRAFKTELDPNDKQRTAFVRHCGVSRFAYNWGLEQKKAAMDAGEKLPSAFDLIKAIVARKRGDLPWLAEVSKHASEQPLRDLDAAFTNFFRRCKKGAKKKGFPQFKSRKKGIGSFRSYRYEVFSDSIRLPRIGKVRLKQRDYLPVGICGKPTEKMKFLGAAISERAGRWYVSVQVEMEIPDPLPRPNASIVGVDFGIKTLATCSDGTVFPAPKAYKRHLRKLRRLSRSLSRKEKGSKNRDKAKRVLARHHAHIANIRSNALHLISHRLTRDNQAVVIENLNVAGMVKNRHLAQAISDCGWGELRRQLEYKGAWRGCEIIVAGRWFPSSKTCSGCARVLTELALSQRVFRCECGLEIDRDLNAAINLRNVAVRMSDTQNACGEKRSGEVATSRETVLCEAGTEQLLLWAV